MCWGLLVGGLCSGGGMISGGTAMLNTKIKSTVFPTILNDFLDLAMQLATKYETFKALKCVDKSFKGFFDATESSSPHILQRIEIRIDLWSEFSSNHKYSDTNAVETHAKVRHYSKAHILPSL